MINRISKVMRNRFVLAAIITISGLSANAETMFYCTKDGKNIISDRPCAIHAAREQKRIDGRDLPPLNATQGPTQGQIDEGKRLDERMKLRAQVRDDQQRKEDKLAADQQKKEKTQEMNIRTCLGLERKRYGLIEALQEKDPPYLKSLKIVLGDTENEMRRVGCELH